MCCTSSTTLYVAAMNSPTQKIQPDTYAETSAVGEPEVAQSSTHSAMHVPLTKADQSVQTEAPQIHGAEPALAPNTVLEEGGVLGVVVPLLPWVPVNIRWFGKVKMVSALARDYLKTLTFRVCTCTPDLRSRLQPSCSRLTTGGSTSANHILHLQATLDAARLCTAGYLGPESVYGVLEYKNGRWKQPMALAVSLRHERCGPRGATQIAEFVASSYPEDGWAYVVEYIESLELKVDPNFD